MRIYRKHREEQIIYVDPEETITDVRQRLEQSVAPRVVLVIPQPTQLRGSVAWKLLYRCAQEYGRDLRIVSDDVQICAWARSANIKILPTKKPISA